MEDVKYTITGAELIEMQTLAKDAAWPMVQFNDSFEEMKTQAMTASKQSSIELHNKLKKINDLPF